MKKRWMKNIVDTSLQGTPDLPFSRRVRHAARMTPVQPAMQIA